MSFCFINYATAQNEGVSKKEIKEYETLIADCYDEDGNPLEVSKTDAARIEVIYKNMTEKQKQKLEKKDLPNPTDVSGTAKGVKKISELLPSDATYFIDEKAISSEEALETINGKRFRMVRKKKDEGYEFHITLL
ncbi:MAG: hypothetical protein AB8G11_23740 [Saprospiraceae bacterium]